jgi:hypothetical protein
MDRVFLAPLVLSLTLLFVLGFVVGQSLNLGWGLPLGTSLTCFIAALGLGATFYHSYSVRRHNRLLVRPHIIFDSQFNNTTLDSHHTYLLKAKNVGLGPAIIEKFTVSFDNGDELDGNTMFTELLKLVNKHTPAKGKAHCKAGFLYTEHALDKGQEKTLIEVSIPKEERDFMQGRQIAKDLVKKINASVNYKCHYGTKLQVERQYDDLPNQ